MIRARRNPSATSLLGAISDHEEENSESKSGSQGVFSPLINEPLDLQLPIASGSFLTATRALKAIVCQPTSATSSKFTGSTASDDADDHDLALLRKASSLIEQITYSTKLISNFFKTFPRNFRNSQTLSGIILIHKGFIGKQNPCAIPGYLSVKGDGAGALSVTEADEWFYIHATAVHLYACHFNSQRHLAKIEKLSLSHGEGWTDVNIWTHLLDNTFLYSSTLSLDRNSNPTSTMP